MAPRPLRGQIWEFDLDPKRGREQKGIRPCLIVSTDALNRSGFGTVIACPVTTRERASFRWRPRLTPDDLRLVDSTWEPRPHWVATDQLVTVDIEARALRHLATVAESAKMAAVDDSLRMLLDL
jgi:mRNA-degrading endonuclease toxin of MazEF toxin-antitoxin module